jgi:hypothetical protein
MGGNIICLRSGRRDRPISAIRILSQNLFACRRGGWSPKNKSTLTTFLVGASPPEANIEGGGLILDFIPKGGSAVKRIIFGFNDVALWVEFSS